MNILLVAYIIFSAIVFLFLISLDISHYIKRKKGEPARLQKYEPEVLVIIPCRGRDLTLQRNLSSISKQEYKKYKVVAVVDNADDEAVKMIKKTGIECLVAGKPIGRSSGKTNAILAAIAKYKKYDIYVVADSDIEVDSLWLKNLIAPMANKRVGISTMFPYFNPMGGFWTKVKLVWGFVGESLLESESSRFGWGGSLAFRRDLVDKWFLNLTRNTRYGVSDDICITMAARKHGMKIAYTKLSQPVVNSDENFSRLFEWANRQTSLTLLGYRKNLYVGVVYYSAEIVTFISAILLSILISPIFLIYFLHLIRGIVKAYQRSRKIYIATLFVVPIMPFFYLSNLLIANRMREITWRGRTYPLK